MNIKPIDLAKEVLKLKKIMTSAKKGTSTGFRVLDEMLLLNKTYLLLCTGNGGMGKSEFLDAVALNTALANEWKWAFFSPENFPIAEHVKKHIERYVGKGLWQITIEEVEQAIEAINSYFTWLDPPEDKLSIEDLLSEIEKIKYEQGLDAYILDPWNEIDHSKYAHLRDDQYLSLILTKIRRFNKKHDLLGCIVIHPKGLLRDKDGNYPVPTLSDCHGGIMWRNKADYGLCLHRHDMSKDRTTLYIQKIKFKSQGCIGAVEFDYDKASGRFKSMYDNSFEIPKRSDLPF